MNAQRLTLDQALERLHEALEPASLPAVVADRDDPPADRSSMDGMALRAEDGLQPRRLTGILHAGDEPGGHRVEAGTCVQIMTGAVVPPGADTVVPIEDVELEEGRVLLLQAPQRGRFIRVRGEQARMGDRLAEPGPRTAARIGLMAQVGTPLPPLRRIRVGLASTGDEVVAHPAPHQIRDSNGPMLRELATLLGAEVHLMPPVPDDLQELARFIERGRNFDIVLTSGGVSMGVKDHLPRALELAGADLLFHRIQLKPGKPMLAALLGPTLFLGLPGNPVSAYLNARIFLPLALARLQGRPVPSLWRQGRLTSPVENPDDRPLLHPCGLEGSELFPLPSKGSADLVRLAQADVCAWIPPGGLGAEETRYLEVI